MGDFCTAWDFITLNVEQAKSEEKFKMTATYITTSKFAAAAAGGGGPFQEI